MCKWASTVESLASPKVEFQLEIVIKKTTSSSFLCSVAFVTQQLHDCQMTRLHLGFSVTFSLLHPHMTGLHRVFSVTSSLLHPLTSSLLHSLYRSLIPSLLYSLMSSHPHSLTPPPSPLHPHTYSRVPVLVFTVVAIACSITTMKDVRAAYCKQLAAGRKY